MFSFIIYDGAIASLLGNTAHELQVTVCQDLGE